MKNQLPKSAKQLSQILLDYRTNLVKNGTVSDINGTSELAAKLSIDDPNAPPLAKFLAGINGGKGIMSCHYYWDFRDAVQEFQVANNISSVEWKTVTWKGEKLRYPTICDQLQCMEQDIPICAKYKNKVTAKYLDFVSRWNLPIFLGDNDGYYSPSNAETVLAEASKYQWAQLWRGSDCFPVHSMETRKVLFYVAEYGISFNSGDAEDPEKEGVSFQARQELTV